MAYFAAKASGNTGEADKAFGRLAKAAGGSNNVWTYCASMGSTGTGSFEPHDPGYPDPWPTTVPGATYGRSPG
jgi:hypothetical protein